MLLTSTNRRPTKHLQMIKRNKGRGSKFEKGYIAVFVCFTTKALHLEVVSDLSSDSFIAPLKRFCGRRGYCTQIYSDNGTNFVGANTKLNEIQKLFYSQQHMRIRFQSSLRVKE